MVQTLCIFTSDPGGLEESPFDVGYRIMGDFTEVTVKPVTVDF